MPESDNPATCHPGLPPGAATRHPDLGTPYTQYSILYTLIFGQLVNRSTSAIICPLPSVICHLPMGCVHAISTSPPTGELFIGLVEVTRART